MDEFLTEKEQIEQIRTWWSENGRFVITGLVLGIACLAGWRYWQNYKVERAEAASTVYERLLEAVERTDRDAAGGLAEQLRGDFGATPYADQGTLAMARLYMDTGDADQAAETLRRLVADADTEVLRHVARLRLARVLVHQGRADEALPLVQRVEAGSFASQYYELRGDIHVARNDMAAAREAYQQALDNAQPGLTDTGLLEMKLNDAAGSEAGGDS